MKTTVAIFLTWLLTAASLVPAEDSRRFFKSGQEAWTYYELDDHTKVRLEHETSPGILNPGGTAWAVRLYHYPEKGAPLLLWEEKHDSSLWDAYKAPEYRLRGGLEIYFASRCAT